jgi:hypothetical protein
MDCDGRSVVALSIAPVRPKVPPGQLDSFSLANLQRRIKAVLDQIGVGAALGGVDISFNEDADGEYRPFWSIHLYIITATANRARLGRELRTHFAASRQTPRPTKVVRFTNVPRRRSYAFKMHFKRRVGHDKKRLRGGKVDWSRNTTTQRLRQIERLELFLFLDKVGLTSRVVFRGCEPRISLGRVSIEPH